MKSHTLVVFCFVKCHSLVGTLSWAHNLFFSDVSVSGLINDTSLLSPCLALSVSSLEHACMCQFLLRAIASNPIILDSCGLKKLKTQIKNQPSAYALDAIFTYHKLSWEKKGPKFWLVCQSLCNSYCLWQRVKVRWGDLALSAELIM